MSKHEPAVSRLRSASEKVLASVEATLNWPARRPVLGENRFCRTWSHGNGDGRKPRVHGTTGDRICPPPGSDRQLEASVSGPHGYRDLLDCEVVIACCRTTMPARKSCSVAEILTSTV